MEPSIKKSDRVLSDGGVVYVILSVELPEIAPEGRVAKRLCEYYGALERLYRAAAEKYFKEERSAYERDTDPRKRFTHRPLRLCCRTEISGEGPYRIFRRIRLTRGGAVLFQKESAETVDLARGLLPEPKRKREKIRAKRPSVRQGRRRRAEGR